MGFLRIFLALCVVGAHTIDGPFNFGGREAVLLFYIISGFYMSLILNKKYTGPHANINFYKSRYLRLWVPYMAVLFFTVIGYTLIDYWHFYLKAYEQAPWGYGIFAGLSNIFIAGQDILWLFSTDDAGLIYHPIGNLNFNGSDLSLDSPLFSVSLEIYFYLMAPFILRSKLKTFLFASAGLIYHLALKKLGINTLDATYHLFPATIAYFGIGAMLFHVSQKPIIKKENFFLAFLILGMAASMNSFVPRNILLGFIVLLPFIFALTKNWSFDQMIGELSYGIYIIHWPMIKIINNLFPDYLGIGQFACVSLFTVTASIILYAVIERPLSRYRRRFADQVSLDFSDKSKRIPKDFSATSLETKR